MKRFLFAIVAVLLALSLCSCTSEKELYGAWFVDEGDVRNAIQFSETEDGRDAFIWAVYNIKEDSIESSETGEYRISGDKIIFDFGSDTTPLELTFELEGNTLKLSSETAVMTLEKFVLDE